MEDLGLTNFWQDRPVFITGHTGFMGGWLAHLLLMRGARVHGYALPAPNEQTFFEVTRLASHMKSSSMADIRDPERLTAALCGAQPEIVFHLAAQPLVRAAYDAPLNTFSTNVMGTAQLLDALRNVPSVRAAVIVTTDKVYQNENRAAPYNESDRLGGREPYSASKAATEFVVDAWRSSYLQTNDIGVATIRAGNIFGGGDWAENRLVPDAMRAFIAGNPLLLRHPGSTRPWQHVLDPLPGYLALAEKLASDRVNYSSAWNFGPTLEDCRPVGELAQMLADSWGDNASVEIIAADSIFEETFLTLDSKKAQTHLGWHSRWPLTVAVSRSTQWYKAFAEGRDMHDVTCTQIAEFESGRALAQ